MEEPLFHALSRFAREVATGDIPDEIWLEAKYCLLDTLGCMIAGAPLPEGLMFAKAEARFSPGDEARVIGRAMRLSAAGAARVNGYNGDILELNDLIGGHASIGAVSAALALAESERLGGRAFLRALIAGIETTARVNLAYRESHGGLDNKPFTEVGISSEGIPSTIGVSALTSVALELDEGETFNALGIAGTLAGWCPVEVLFGEGGTVKPMMFGAWPATVGMMAGRYASAGMTGPTRLLESSVGLYATLAKGFDPDILRGSLGWQLAKPRRKWHACCGFIHAGMDGVVQLRRQFGPEIFDGATIEVGVVPPVVEVLSNPAPPASETEARFSGGFCLGLAVAGVDRIDVHHAAGFATYLTDPLVSRTLPTVRYVPNDALPHFSHSQIRVVGPEGVRAETLIAGYKGSASQPLTHAEVEQKFLSLAGNLLRHPDVYMSKVLSLQSFDDLGFLFEESVPSE